MSPKIGILLFVIIILIIQTRNSYILYSKRQNKNFKFYVDLVAITLTFPVCFWVLYYFVFK